MNSELQYAVPPCMTKVITISYTVYPGRRGSSEGHGYCEGDVLAVTGSALPSSGSVGSHPPPASDGSATIWRMMLHDQMKWGNLILLQIHISCIILLFHNSGTWIIKDG